MNWLLQRKFLALLLALGFLLVVYPLLHGFQGDRLLYDALFTLVALTAFQVIFTKRHLRLMAVLLGFPILIGVWTGYALPGLPQRPLALGFHLASLVLLSFTVGVILRTIHTESRISPNHIYGALCGYLLVGVAFGHVYCIIEMAHPGSFRGSAEFMDQIRQEGGCRYPLTYFSFITLTTVGYGDVAPASESSRGLAIIEAVMGQFYMAVLVAELIGKRLSQALDDQQTASVEERNASRAFQGGNEGAMSAARRI
jgi:hypothetical protein